MNSHSLSCYNEIGFDAHTLSDVLYTALMQEDFAKALGFRFEVSDRVAPSAIGPHLLCKMKGKGHFGLAPDIEHEKAAENKDKGSDACPASYAFALYYFPKPEEALCARMRLDAVMESQGPRYADKVRSFHSHADFAACFRMGTVCLHHEQGAEGEQAVFLSFEAEKAQRILAPEGVGDSTSGWAVVAGDFEEDVPALDLCRPFFHCLAAAMTLGMAKAPQLFMRGLLPSMVRHRLADGSLICPSNSDGNTCAWASQGEEDSENGRMLELIGWHDGTLCSTWPDMAFAQSHVQTRFVREEGMSIEHTSALPEDSKVAPYWLCHDSDALHAMAQRCEVESGAGQHTVTLCTALLGEDFASRVRAVEGDKASLFVLLLDPEQSGMRICQSEEARDYVRRADVMVCLYDAQESQMDQSFEGHSVAMTALSATLHALNPKAPVYSSAVQDFAIQDLVDKIDQESEA